MFFSVTQPPQGQKPHNSRDSIQVPQVDAEHLVRICNLSLSRTFAEGFLPPAYTARISSIPGRPLDSMPVRWRRSKIGKSLGSPAVSHVPATRAVATGQSLLPTGPKDWSLSVHLDKPLVAQGRALISSMSLIQNHSNILWILCFHVSSRNRKKYVYK